MHPKGAPTLMKYLLLFALLMSSTLSAAETPKTESAIIGGGCFWCTEGVYQMIPGVVHVTSGYSGGKNENPTYKQICTGTTGHAEVVKVDYDPAKISFKELIDLFWYAHDPTTLNYQGNDHGTQYRSVIFYTSDGQKADAEKSKAEHNAHFNNNIVTEISPLTKFYPAEDYHQNFANENPDQGYVCAIVKPKMAKFKEKLAAFEKKRAK